MNGKVREEARKAAHDAHAVAGMVFNPDVSPADRKRRSLSAAIDAYEAALKAAGYVMVPREPSKEMKAAAAPIQDYSNTPMGEDFAAEVWDAMIEAATNPAP